MSEEVIDFTGLTLQQRVNHKLAEANRLEAEAEQVETTLLKEVLNAKARGIRGTVFALAEEEYKEFFEIQGDLEPEVDATEGGVPENEPADYDPEAHEFVPSEPADYDPEAHEFVPSEPEGAETPYGDGEGA